MISNEQIAHDLSIAKLSGSNLQTKELIEQYRKYKNEIMSVLEPSQKSTIKRSPY